jgi:Tfp pilus assembly protein PilX
MIGRLIRRFLREEDGVALVMAIAAMAILAITTTGVIIAGTANEQTSFVSTEARAAFATAEQALAYGEGMVYSNVTNGVAVDTTQTFTLPAQPGLNTSGTYRASVVNSTTWHITATGTVGTVTRTVGADVTPSSTTTIQNTAIWSYIYSDSTSQCLSITGNLTITVPMISRGNICLSGGSHIVNPAGGSPIAVEAGGTLSDIGGSNMGTSASSLARVQIGGCTAWAADGTCTASTANSCTVQPSSVFTVAPGTSYCDGTQTPLWASTVNSNLTVTPAMPCIGQSSTLDPQCPSTTASWSSLVAYYNAQKAATKTGCPANLLDSDATLNNSLSSATLSAAMFPHNTAYDCKVTSAGGTLIGEIKWTPSAVCSSATLQVTGILVFDGSVDLGCGWKVIYSGEASLWFTGTFQQSGGDWLCGIANCTTSWNPSVNAIAIVATCWSNSTGTTLVASACVHIGNGSTAQWATYATTNYQLDGGSTNMGPAMANTVTLGGGAQQMIPFGTLPPGIPVGTVTTTVAGLPPANWAG